MIWPEKIWFPRVRRLYSATAARNGNEFQRFFILFLTTVPLKTQASCKIMKERLVESGRIDSASITLFSIDRIVFGKWHLLAVRQSCATCASIFFKFFFWSVETRETRWTKHRWWWHLPRPRMRWPTVCSPPWNPCAPAKATKFLQLRRSRPASACHLLLEVLGGVPGSRNTWGPCSYPAGRKRGLFRCIRNKIGQARSQHKDAVLCTTSFWGR